MMCSCLNARARLNGSVPTTGYRPASGQGRLTRGQRRADRALRLQVSRAELRRAGVAESDVRVRMLSRRIDRLMRPGPASPIEARESGQRINREWSGRCNLRGS
jgi:hypothetical protein